jgi:hypothetical protein
MKHFCVLVSVALIVACCGPALVAHGGTVTYTDSVPQTVTNWNNSVSVPLFDPSLGTLDSVSFTMTGYVQGTGQFESLDATPSTVTMDLAATLKLKRPSGSTLVISLPDFNTSDNVTAYDGITDFGGTSGKTYSNVGANDTESVNTSSPSDMTLFTGVGNITLPVSATGSSNASGPGNIVESFATTAWADVSVTYNYQVVPEPSTLALLGIGAIGLLAWRRRQAA